MKRVDNVTGATELPTYAAGTNPNRYFTDGTPGVADGTVPGQDWFNMVQEELVNAITDDGDTLDGSDDTQLAQRLSPLKGIRTSATTASGPTTHDRAVIATGTEYASASGDSSAVVACDGIAIASGATSVVVASTGAVTASGDSSAVVACGGTGAVASGDASVVVASTNVTVEKDNAAAIGGYYSKIAESFNAQGSVLLGGVRCELASDGKIGTGYHLDTVPTFSGTNQNLTWLVDVASGNNTSDGSFTGGGADYAEYYEAVDHAAPPPVGALVTREGTCIRLANTGDRVLGPVSGAAGVLGNAAALSWAGRFVLDEWGRRVTRQYEGGQVWYVESPDYDPSVPYVPRSERPEWVPVGLLGQVRVRVDATVGAGDDVTAGPVPGVGTRGQGRGRPIVCVAVESEYDAARGYAIALCDVG